MKRIKLPFLVVTLLATSLTKATHAQDNIRIWKEFVVSLQKGEITPDNIRPYHQSLKEPMMGFLTSMRKRASWEEWEATPEIYRVENQIHYLISLSFDGNKATYCFSFLTESDKWYFQHLEGIFIRLDETPGPPTSTFPDIPEEHKAWIREEAFWSQQVNLFNSISTEKGKDFALSLFKDGGGYSLAAKAWVPFVPASRAFILYLCWEQANLRGNDVTLEKLETNEAIVRVQLTYFSLYQHSAHLKQQISLEEYRLIFETIWQDRATQAGWNLEIQYEQDECVLHFRKTT